MQSSLQLLDAIKKRHKLTSDYQLAKILGVTTQRISHYRAGRRRAFSEETALRVAELLQVAPGYVLAIGAGERAKEESVRKAWEKAAKTLAGTAVALLVGCTVIAAGPGTLDITQSIAHFAAQSADLNIHYAQLKIALAGVVVALWTRWTLTYSASTR